MMVHPRAGQPALPEDLVDLPHLITAYYSIKPDVSQPEQQVVFGTSGHRGSSLDGGFNENHILAITQAIVEYRQSQGISGPLFLGRDTHGLSEPAWVSALEVLLANGVTVMIDKEDRYTPTPAVSHAILAYNRALPSPGSKQGNKGHADGIVVTPSHNPPRDGGFKYNPPHGGPADSAITERIARRANDLLRLGLEGVRRVSVGAATSSLIVKYDYMGNYVNDLENIVDMKAIKHAGIRIGADPLGGAAVDYWPAIADHYGLDITVVNPLVDATWRFMTLDSDGKIRMDSSSPYAMASLIKYRNRYDIATGNDADSDRHGIVTPDTGLMNPNHYLSVAIDYLCSHRPRWPEHSAIGKTLVSSSMIDRVTASRGKELYEVPVGFKWFVDGLLDGSLSFGGEESAGASFSRFDGGVWTTDKDGIILALLASEILAVTGESPSARYLELAEEFGNPAYARTDAPATREQKAILGQLSPNQVKATELAGEPITATLTRAPGNNAEIGGLKVCTKNAWFAARPSGTEDIYKIYAESFIGLDHLHRVQEEAQALVTSALQE